MRKIKGHEGWQISVPERNRWLFADQHVWEIVIHSFTIVGTLTTIHHQKYE